MPPKDKDDQQPFAQNAAPPGGAPAHAAPPPMVGAGGGGAPLRGYAPAPAQESKSAAPSAFDTALGAYQAGRYDDATRAFDALAANDPNAELWAARSVREGKGCRSAIARFDRVAGRASGSPPGWDALLEGALCYRSINEYAKARVRLNALLVVDSHKDRARAELDRLDELQKNSGQVMPPSGAAKPAPRKAAPPASNVDTSY
jgi:hypothetical protein